MFDGSTTARAEILPGADRGRTDPLAKPRRDITRSGPGFAKPFIAYLAKRVLETACGTCSECRGKCPVSCQSAIDTVGERFCMTPVKVRALAARTSKGGRVWARRSDGLSGYLWKGPYDTRACEPQLAEFQAWEAARSDGIELRQLAEVIAAVPERVEVEIERDRMQAMQMYRSAASLAEQAASMLQAAAAILRRLDERTREVSL